MVSLGLFSLFCVVFLVFSAIYYGEFCLYVATSFFGILVFCPEIYVAYQMYVTESRNLRLVLLYTF